jgi:hypothetical protein
MTIPCVPRQLSPEETALAEFLLSVEFPGHDELRKQLKLAQVTGTCECGCGTILIRVNHANDKAVTTERVVVEAYGKGVDVLMFVRDGALSSIEIVDHGDARPLRYPKPEELSLWVPPPRSSGG